MYEVVVHRNGRRICVLGPFDKLTEARASVQRYIRNTHPSPDVAFDLRSVRQ